MPFQLPVIISTEILVLILGHLFSGLLGIAYRAKSKNDPVINAFLQFITNEIPLFVPIAFHSSKFNLPPQKERTVPEL